MHVSWAVRNVPWAGNACMWWLETAACSAPSASNGNYLVVLACACITHSKQALPARPCNTSAAPPRAPQDPSLEPHLAELLPPEVLEQVKELEEPLPLLLRADIDPQQQLVALDAAVAALVR